MLHAIGAHLKATQAQKGCCYALALLAVDADSQVRAASLGGIQAVLHAMSAHLKATQAQDGMLFCTGVSGCERGQPCEDRAAWEASRRRCIR